MATNFIDGVTVVTADFLNDLFGDNGHVHDGQDQDGSAPKVSLEDHVDYDGDGDGAEEGFIRVETDTSALHEIQHHHSGSGESTWLADVLKAVSRVVTEAIQPPGGSTAVLIEDQNGNLGRLEARDLVAQYISNNSGPLKVATGAGTNNAAGDVDLGGLRSGLVDQDPTNVVEVETNDGSARGDLDLRGAVIERLFSINDGEASGTVETIELVDSDGNVGEVAIRLDALQGDLIDFQGNVGQSGDGVPYLNTIRSADQSSGYKEVALESNNPPRRGEATLWAVNTLKAAGAIEYNDTTVSPFPASHGFESATRQSQGVYDVTLSRHAPDGEAMSVTVTPTTSGVLPSVTVQSTNSFRIELADPSGSAVDSTVHVHVAHPGDSDDQP